MADDELVRSLRRAGAHVAVAETLRPRAVRTLMLTDLVWARAARQAAERRLRELLPRRPRSVIYSTTTAALLWPLPGAVRFDAPAVANRPGRHGLWQRPLERLRLRQAPLLLPWSEGGLTEARLADRGREARALVLPVPFDCERTDIRGVRDPATIAVETDVRARDAQTRDAQTRDALTRDALTRDAQNRDALERDIAAITYAGNPTKKGFDRVLAAWRGARRPGERLVVVGIARDALRAAGFDLPDADVEVTGPIARPVLGALLRRARVFVCAPRREDYGLIQLEALAEGCRLVTTPAPGPYVALSLARQLDPRLVGEDLGAALRDALDTPLPGYATRAATLLEPYGRAASDRLVAEQLLPRLLGE
jgi:glycosyltransferase involved in cell wall biosynthesis